MARNYRRGDNFITAASNTVSDGVGKFMGLFTKAGSRVNTAVYTAGNATIAKGAKIFKKRKKR